MEWNDGGLKRSEYPLVWNAARRAPLTMFLLQPSVCLWQLIIHLPSLSRSHIFLLVGRCFVCPSSRSPIRSLPNSEVITSFLQIERRTRPLTLLKRFFPSLLSQHRSGKCCIFLGHCQRSAFIAVEGLSVEQTDSRARRGIVLLIEIAFKNYDYLQHAFNDVTLDTPKMPYHKPLLSTDEVCSRETRDFQYNLDLL